MVLDEKIVIEGRNLDHSAGQTQRVETTTLWISASGTACYTSKRPSGRRFALRSPADSKKLFQRESLERRNHLQ